MTELRKKMIKAMELKNLSKHTQRNYLNAVKGLAQYYHKSPDKLTKEMIEDYLLYLKNEKSCTPGSCAAVVSGLRFFYNNITDKPITIDYSVPDKGCKLPTVLTQKEVWDIICAPKNLKHRLILMATYSAGLRAGEVAALKPENVGIKKGGRHRWPKLLNFPKQSWRWLILSANISMTINNLITYGRSTARSYLILTIAVPPIWAVI